jgi:iron complex transport system substrate-binding protein
MTRRLGAALALLCLLAAPAALAASFIDSAGRQVELPAHVDHVFPAGPPASAILYMVAPEKLLGWTAAPSPGVRAFMPARYADLPEVGRLTGRGNTANLEAVVKAGPDLILDVGSLGPTYASLAERVQEQTHIPYALIGGSLADTPATLRTLGQLLGATDNA